MEKVISYGRMVLDMKETGETVWQKDKELFIMQTVMSILENFTKIELMDLEFIFIKMVKNTRDFGRMINKKVLEERN
jgi:hypothetical protein